MASRKFIPVLASLLILQLSCKEDTKQVSYQSAQLTGRWEMTTAVRNGKPIETLVGTYFEFDESGKMRTNLTKTTLEEEFPYQFSGVEIKQKSDPPTFYTIDTLNESMLGMSMTLNNFLFKLSFKKAVPPTPETEAPDTSAVDTVSDQAGENR